MIRRLTAESLEGFEAVYRLFSSEFDASTLEPRDELATAWASGRESYLVWDEEEAIRGAVRFYLDPSRGFGAIIHVATDTPYRGRGIAEALVGAVQAEAGALPLLLEVGPGDERGWWIRRGARTLTETYVQPSLGAGLPDVPLHLMALGVVQDRSLIVRAFYEAFWGLSPADPRVLNALEGISR